jgi:hypothetical protein
MTEDEDQEIVAAQPDLLGQALAQVILTERTETWVSWRRSETRRRIIAPLANRLLHPAELPAATRLRQHRTRRRFRASAIAGPDGTPAVSLSR